MRHWQLGLIAGGIVLGIAATGHADPVTVTHFGGLLSGTGMDGSDSSRVQRWGVVDNLRAGIKRRAPYVQDRTLSYAWETPNGSLETGATVNLDGHGIFTKLVGATESFFANRGLRVRIALFGGTGNELVVGDALTNPFTFSGTQVSSDLMYHISGSINYGLVLSKDDRTLEIIKGTIAFNPTSEYNSYNKIGETANGVAFNLVGVSTWGEDACSFSRTRDCEILRAILGGSQGMGLRLGLSGSDPNALPGGNPGGNGGDNDGTGPIAINDPDSPGQDGSPGGGSSDLPGAPSVVVAVPEPASAGLILAALAGLARLRRRYRNA